ncbi:methyltransferase domain-containing protein [Brevibacillus centrosporus]|uniref:methyltransferase domain-containing protein n=1 Tax=Brevibacillus centrosporus TaxID=54910 RepID=UPI002E210882|nr:methyltransferase domain-containing protein [Brevibacillus centrosporus]
MARLHLINASCNNNEYTECVEDKDVKAYIEQTPDGNYSHVLQRDGRWEVFYHLTEMRRSLLNWYEFKGNARLLEIGGGMGALTGLFCDKCDHVTSVEASPLRAKAIHSRYRDTDNLDIYSGSIYNIEFENKFDYITVIGSLEFPTAEFMRKLASLLNPEGKLLLAIDNRFGIKYWCGNREEHSGIPFEGINGYPSGGRHRTFGKKELEKLLTESGLNQYKFYYPMPDYKLPQLIYSEEYLPQNSLQSRLIPYYVDSTTLLASEMELYDELIENGVFEFFSNSFLVECGFDQNFCSVMYAAVTTDRPPSDCFSTTIHKNNIVIKTPLKPEGQARIQQVHDNLMDLQSRGFRIVPNKIEKNKLVMARIDGQSLESYLKSIVKKDKELFVTLMDKLYECILNSSDWVEPKLNPFCLIHPELDFGPILKRAYIDLIPNNCFVSDNEYIFFDQEFSKDNYPARFIMFRALKYTYLFIPWADEFISLEGMKDRYDLVKVWGVFEEEEARFVRENRNYSVYKNFLEWSNTEKKVFELNAKKLTNSIAAEFLLRRKYRKIAIYGFGDLGTKLYRDLKKSDVEVAYAIDRNADYIAKTRHTDIPILLPDNKLEQVDVIVVSVIDAFTSIQATLEGRVNCPVISLGEILSDKLL